MCVSSRTIDWRIQNGYEMVVNLVNVDTGAWSVGGYSGMSLRRMPPGRRYMRSCMGSSPTRKRSRVLPVVRLCPELLKAVLASCPAHSSITSAPPGCCNKNNKSLVS